MVKVGLIRKEQTMFAFFVFVLCIISLLNLWSCERHLRRVENQNDLAASSVASAIYSANNSMSMYTPQDKTPVVFATDSNHTAIKEKDNIFWIRNPPPPKDEPKPDFQQSSENRFIVFREISNAQGAGNHLQGMLAAHLFGLEFNRTVCVVWDKFWEAFEYSSLALSRGLDEKCKGARAWKSSTTIHLWNFGSGKAANECTLYDQLASTDKVVGMNGNTYPAWRTEVPDQFFWKYFKAKKELIQVLPRIGSTFILPKVVVHLRAPDGTADNARGLDDESLENLGKMLQGNSTYLVTNRPDYYKRFEECCGWSHDKNWEGKPIAHGAMHILWREDGTKDKSKQKLDEEQAKLLGNQNLKMWADWYVMLQAQDVYHSNSDFSRSAVHWNPQCTGHQLNGMKNVDGKRVLNLVPAEYADKSLGRIVPLGERKRPSFEDGEKYDDDKQCAYLRHCGKYVPKADARKDRVRMEQIKELRNRQSGDRPLTKKEIREQFKAIISNDQNAPEANEDPKQYKNFVMDPRQSHVTIL